MSVPGSFVVKGQDHRISLFLWSCRADVQYTYTYMYVCMHACIYVHMCMYVCTYVHKVCLHIYIHRYTHLYRHTYLYCIHMDVYIRIRGCFCIQVCICTHICKMNRRNHVYLAI